LLTFLSPYRFILTAIIAAKLLFWLYSTGSGWLTDQNIVNLSQDFSLYFYAAIATEIPKGVVPIQLTL